MPKVLIITYYWPPGAGAGVQRWVKFAKYLPESGWEPVVLTVDPEYATFPALDPSLENDISPALQVIKTKATDYFRIYRRDKSKIPSAGFAANEGKGIFQKIIRFIRGNFFIPDPRKGWNKFAFKKACEIIANQNINYVITTSPPHSTQLIGLKIKKKIKGIKWIADLRDPWLNIYYYNQFYPTFISRYIDSRYELKVLKVADRIITIGNSLKDLFASKICGIANKIDVIPNGYDEQDFSGISETKPEPFTISYIGTLSDSYPLEGLLIALNNLKKDSKRFILRFVGFISELQRNRILSYLEEHDIEFVDYTNHSLAIKYMLNSSILLLIIPDHQSSRSIITGKLFEYLASTKPVLCLGPEDGDAADYLRSCGHTGIFQWDKHVEIGRFITEIYDKVKPLSYPKPTNYSRKALGMKLGEVLSKS